MKFTPKTDEQINEDGLIPDKTTCDFEVTRAEDKVSKSGNDMIVLTLTVYNDKGIGKTITDYLLESLLYKVLHACSACGLMEKYNSGNLKASDFEGKSGKCVVGIQKGNADYPLDKNNIRDYVKKPEGAKSVELNDDIPF